MPGRSETRARARARFAAGEVRAEHGRLMTYQWWGCRCEQCKAANARRGRAYSPARRPIYRRVEPLDVRAVAVRLGVSRETVRSWRKFGQLPAADGHFGKIPWWYADAVDRWNRDVRPVVIDRHRRRSTAAAGPSALLKRAQRAKVAE